MFCTHRSSPPWTLFHVFIMTTSTPCPPPLLPFPEKKKFCRSRPHSQRARQRWQLALILARNPSGWLRVEPPKCRYENRWTWKTCLVFGMFFLVVFVGCFRKTPKQINSNQKSSAYSWWLEDFFFTFLPLSGKMIQFDWRFSKLGWNHRVVLVFECFGSVRGGHFLGCYISIQSGCSWSWVPFTVGFFISKSCCGLRQFLAPHPTWRLVVLRGSEQTLLQPAEGWGHLFERVKKLPSSPRRVV